MTHICFTPQFVEAPVQFRINELQWRPRGSFIGEPDARFRVELNGSSTYHFDGLQNIDKLLCREREIKHGRYTCQVFLQHAGLFDSGREDMLFESELVIGDENEFRFDGKELMLTQAIFWDLQADGMSRNQLRPGAALLEDLRYLGMDAPEWENIPMPAYMAVMSFETADCKRISFNNNPNKREYLLINPVTIWVVNEKKLILADADGEIVYYDTATNTIPNRDPMQTMTKAAQMARLQNPDYFEYETRRARDV